MESIFDRITTPSQATYGQSPAQPATASGAAATLAIGSTGIIASIESEEFDRLVRDAVDPVVLRTAAAGPSNGGGTRRIHRYVFSCAGIIFVTQTGNPLKFGAGVREVECLGVLCDGKPIGRSDSSIV